MNSIKSNKIISSIPLNWTGIKILDLGFHNFALGPTALGQNYGTLGQELFMPALFRGIELIYYSVPLNLAKQRKI